MLITISLLCAAGLAAYENPQVRQWIDESRRKVAVALHSLGDELSPDSESKRASNESNRRTSQDASVREDEDPEAVERRRKARQEILERGRMMEERRRSKQNTDDLHTATSKAKSFDDLVDKDGALKAADTTATTTAAEPLVEGSGLRHRRTDSQAAAPDSSSAASVAEEVSASSPATAQEDPPSRSSTPTLPMSPMSPPVPPKPAAYQPQRLLINTEQISNHPSEQLIDLTPTTSASSVNAELTELDDNRHPSQSSYWSVNEWAQTSGQPASSTSPRSDAAGVQERPEELTRDSEHGSGEHINQSWSEDSDAFSDDDPAISTPGSWTEVGSEVSEDY